jgi:hypothetical protein
LTAGAALDLSPELALLGAPCAEEALLKGMWNSFHLLRQKTRRIYKHGYLISDLQ